MFVASLSSCSLSEYLLVELHWPRAGEAPPFTFTHFTGPARSPPAPALKRTTPMPVNGQMRLVGRGCSTYLGMRASYSSLLPCPSRHVGQMHSDLLYGLSTPPCTASHSIGLQHQCDR